MKTRNFVNLNVNPCKCCMPMGASIAFKGIESTMVLLHGSQGCSTYIRRHMAGHYNEPIDIASSSLNEKETIHGGAENLKKGLKNTLRLYNPRMVGISTTCLAETIGEDLQRIITEFKEEEPHYRDVLFVPVSTPGYGGTNYEGFYYTLKKIVETIAVDTTPINSINIIAGNLTPADIRSIKEIIALFHINYTILPDVSKTLDAPFTKDFQKLSPEGTKISDIEKMAGASATIEMGMLISEDLSPGKYLEETFGVPLYRCPLPIGLKNTDSFIEVLQRITGEEMAEKLKEDRGRMLDGMIDSHKYNAEGRAAIFGEPDIVYAVTKLCLENGIQPLVISTGSKTTKLKRLLELDLKKLDESCMIIDDTDLETIRDYVRELGVNVLIGTSEGKFITEKDGVPLVRIGFPVHDRVGAQRRTYTGYEGSMQFLDEITNTLLEEKYRYYRENLYKKYYQKG
ncbi:nitrogenase component 1 [Clostridium formicaceticum]|uniref:Nitrogenase n=1 Tax=Clostridium formicaceticum TaxID=1497 RepID=A0AAC9WFP3_9CLOT|nr:nitrogenase component 1 [Clostridium formicaceticum]AOY76608.1 nitrogenase [Clostridium formicaceticum]ARE87028.1 Nitrogenase molybdenum-iron protein beta chain [Clostridium formicaceticum]